MGGVGGWVLVSLVMGGGGEWFVAVGWSLWWVGGGGYSGPL